MPYITTKDNAKIYYKDWNPAGVTAGEKADDSVHAPRDSPSAAIDERDLGEPDDGKKQTFVFLHGWPLNSDSWEGQMMFLADNGYRCVAPDRRGHGRSTQTWHGNEMDTYASDLNDLLEELGLRDVILVGFSTGGGVAARYLGTYGGSRVAKAVLLSSVPPLMLQTKENSKGVPMSVFDDMRENSKKNRPQLYKELASTMFFGFNRDGAEKSEGLIDWFWMMGMQAGHKNTFDCIKAFSETDFTEDLKKIDVPTLVLHGDDDQIVPIDAAGRKSVKLVKGATLKEYSGAPHGVAMTRPDEVNQDLLDFAEGKTVGQAG